MDGGYGTGQMPLAGAILCCTSMPPEQRTALAAVGAQMGATIKLDLTSDVTHLIVGNINSAKYRYVAKAREDVKVLSPEWVDALRTVWMEGDDVDVAALEKEYRLPTFYGLKICLTGFDNPDQRKFIQDTAVQNGAEYHGDLTKNVTHLIAATPSGKKYEHAVNWRMQIVSWEWFEQSIQRGMTLDENYYHPTMPVEERGKGAWDRRANESPTLGKRTRDAERGQSINLLRRKLRRSASSKMGSQSEALWAGITAAGLERKKGEEDDWLEEDLTKTSLPNANAPTDQTNNVVSLHDNALPEDPTSKTLACPSNDGIFEGRLVFAHGFDSGKTNILQEHLASNGATIIRIAADLSNFSSDDLRRGYLVMPHDAKTDLTLLPGCAGTMNLVTNWWVERCLHSKCLVDHTEHILCRPFDKLNISGFNGLTINSTAFSGIELLQVTKVVSLMGARYDEYLTTKTSVIVCNTRKPNPEKFKFATDKRIPAVHASWLWDCVRTGELQPFDRYLLNTVVHQPQKPRKAQEPYSEVPTAPLSEEDSAKLRNRKAQSSRSTSKSQSRSDPHRTGTLDLTLSADLTPSATASSTHPNTASDDAPADQSEAVIRGFDGPSSLPLQDIHPSVNSPRRPSTSSNTSGKASTSTSSTSSASRKPAPTTRASRLAKEPTPDSVIPPPTEPVQGEKDYTSIMSNLLAQRKASAEHSLNKEDDKRKRRRQIGRASSTRSNPSTAGDALLRAGSASAPNENASEEITLEKDYGVAKGKGIMEYQPSQELGWDAPGAQEAREQMIRAMGGKVEKDTGVVEPIGVVKDVVGGDSRYSRAGRRRRG